MRRIASFFPVLVLTSLAHAVTLRILTMDEMTTKSTDIVYARVLDSYGAFQGSMIYTHYRVQIIETLKSSKQVTEIMLPGGVANGYRQTFAGVPVLAQGKAYLMFLWAGPAGSPQLTGLTQGLFDVTADKGGNLIASRPSTTEQLLDVNGNAVTDRPVSIQMQQLKRSVNATLTGKGAK
jgi:hypothetical protein